MKKLFSTMLLLYSFLFLSAQITVQGVVTDNSGEALIGVNILEAGTSNGTISDIDGSYSLTVQNGASLVFSFTGMQTMTELVNGRTTINVSMAVSSEILDEVVISALGFRQNKDQMGSTASVISTQDIVRSGESGVINGLAGKASGVRIIRSNGDPGAGSNILIRGANTIQGDGSPLIIVDGIPISNETIYGGGNNVTGGSFGGTSQQSRLNDINPDDIASVQVLKGASAGSLWGSRAANGVIVITTKQGQAGKLKVEYGVTYSMDEINLKHELQTSYGGGTNGSWRNNHRDSWGDRIADRSGGPDEVNTNGQFFTAADGRVFYPITSKNSREVFTDRNFDAVFRNGHFVQHNLSLSGGNEKAQYFGSFGTLDQEGIIIGSEYARRNARFNARFRFNDWISMSTNAGYSYTSSNRIQQNSNVSGFYLGLLRTPPDFDNSAYIGTHTSSSGVETPLRHRSYRRSLGESSNPTYNNPLWTVNEQKNLNKVDRFIFSSEINIDPVDWLRVTLRGGVDDYTDVRDYFFPMFSSSSRSPGVYVNDVLGERELNFDAIGKASFVLTDDIGLTATIGWNINDRAREFNSINLTGFAVNSRQLTFDLNTDPNATTVDRTLRNIRSNRGYGVLNFDLWDKLWVNISGTAEAASSVDGTFFYPSFDVAWQFQEKSLNAGLLSFGKLRASWGQVGVQPGAHRRDVVAETGFSYSTYSDELDVPFLGGGFRLDDDQGDPNIRPEIKTEWELGVDLRLLKDRLGFTATYYQNEIDDLIFSVPATPSSGVDTKYKNGGTMENKGFEFEIDYDVIKQSDWNMNLFANFSRNRNKVLRLDGVDLIQLSGSSTISSNAMVGQPFGALVGSKAVRNPDGSVFLDENGFPVTDAELGFLGDPNASWRGGAGINLSYKNISLNTLFEHSQGGVFADRTRIVLYAIGTHGDTGNEVTLSEDLRNVNGDVIQAGSTVRGNIVDWGAGDVLLDQAWYTTRGGGFGSGVVYDLLLPKATWTRLREISLSYNLKSEAFDRIGLSNLQITLTGRNIALWSDVKGIDPETNVNGVTNGLGIEYFTNPGTRSYLVALKANF